MRKPKKAEPPTPKRWPPNALRTVVYVAARGTAGRTALGAFQRSLPTDTWGEWPLSPDWQPLKPFLSWSTALLGSTRSFLLRDLVGRLHAMSPAAVTRGEERAFLDDVQYLLKGEGPHPLLDQSLEIPRTEVAVKLGYRRSDETAALYDEALRVCADDEERERFGNEVDVDVAARALRDAIPRVRRLGDR
jgi:hypothetical protein